MTRTKSNRIFLGIVTCAMALAGTGLTIANNFEWDLQIAAIAITLAACFTAAEATFLWGHKRFEDSTKLWRRIVLAVSLSLLVCAMGYAVYEELKLALGKISNRGLASNNALIVQGTMGKNQRILGTRAMNMLEKHKLDPNVIPFVVCYVLTGLVSVAILSASERKREKTKGKGDLLVQNPNLRQAIVANPQVQEKITQAGFAPMSATMRIYDEGRGFTVWDKSQYLGYVPKHKVESTLNSK